MEMATEENEKIVSDIYEDIIGEIGKPGRPPDTEELKFVYEVEHFQQEIGSGASFEQYFRWSDKAEIDGIVDKLERLGLAETQIGKRALGSIAAADNNHVTGAVLKLRHCLIKRRK